ncbi:MAG: flagellar hook-basal body complex protein FliE [Kofleriaceae bacterium]
MSGISPIQLPALTSLEGVQKDTPVGGAARSASADGGAFSNVLSDARAAENTATQMEEKFANGDTSIGIHEVMIQAEKANIAIRYATTLKNKAIEAYRELMNTQV